MLQVQLERVHTVRAELCLAVVRLTMGPVALEEELGFDNNDAGAAGEDKDHLRSFCTLRTREESRAAVPAGRRQRAHNRALFMAAYLLHSRTQLRTVRYQCKKQFRGKTNHSVPSSLVMESPALAVTAAALAGAPGPF